ncbi:hypothetical protein HanRHA438_Chr04g0165101 [Helianthus annuus]|nr:hypothetical protein HanRHA438_Chr04g0165101 [Helianthus annuus]
MSKRRAKRETWMKRNSSDNNKVSLRSISVIQRRRRCQPFSHRGRPLGMAFSFLYLSRGLSCNLQRQLALLILYTLGLYLQWQMMADDCFIVYIGYWYPKSKHYVVNRIIVEAL